MKKAAVIIGVNKTGGLPLLAAAVSGAKAFDAWASDQDFDTTLLTDELEPVGLHDVKTAINKYVKAKTYHQLIVFFAGHGILKGPNDEHWLLSGAPEDPNEAVNVSSSKYLAYNTGIPHIVIISDACRSAPANPLILSVMGGVIFPNVQVPGNQPDIDMFYATKPGDAAYEVKDSTMAAQQYRGIFTHCMLKGLNGDEPAIISRIDEGPNKVPVVFPYELKKYLERQVPLDAQAVNIMLNQDPRIEVTSHPPIYLARIDDESLTLPVDNDDNSPGEKSPVFNTSEREQMTSTGLLDHYSFDVKHLLNPQGKKNMSLEIDRELDKLFHARGRESFETQTGLTIIGTNDFDILLDKGHSERFPEGDHEHVRLFPSDKAHTLLFITADGTGTPIAILPGFIGTVMVENNRVVNVNYLPSRTNNRYDDASIRDAEIGHRRAAAALAARHGAFAISGDRHAIMGAASYLRNDKALDPTLGLYSAYAYAQAGNNKAIRSIFNYMQQEPEPVLFDVKMLTMLRDASPAIQQTAHAPFCPMLTQGWSYLSIDTGINTPLLSQLMPHLLPGLWTTFSQEGINIIKQTIKTKAL